jgi:hypothetical protein
MLPDLERTERIRELWSYPKSRNFAERGSTARRAGSLRAVLIGMLVDVAGLLLED